MASEETDPKYVNEELHEGEDGESASVSMSSWFSGWYDTAKAKLSETNEFMKHDLQEFSLAVQQDASRLVAATATTMKEKLNINVDLDEASTATRAVKDSLSSFLGNIANKVGPIRPDDYENADESVIVGTSSGAKVMSRSEARLYAIQTDPATFCNDPDNEEQFFAWLPSFNVEDSREEISTLLLDISQIRALYTKLVPSAVSHSDFWARYFFKFHQHKKAEERRAMLVERAHKTHDDIEWDDEDDDRVQPKNILADIETEKNADSNAEEETPNPRVNTNESLSPDKPAPNTKESLTPDKPAPTTSATAEAMTLKNSEQLPSEGIIATKVTEPKSDKLTIPETVSPMPEKYLAEAAGNEQSKAEPNKSDITEGLKVENKPESPASVNKQLETCATKEDPTKNSPAKLPSSGESSDDWEKDFDLDMTEDEIQQALKESDAVDVNVEDISEDWDEWE